ncbi:MAG: CPBP family glutamic-type intramembrane protease [Patescibacteria group bacterium]
MKKALKIIEAVAIWFFIWTIARFLFYFYNITRAFPFLKNLVEYKYLFFAGWLVLAGIIVFIIWSKKNQSFSFFRLKNKIWLVFYLIPLGQYVYWIFQSETPFSLAGWYYGLVLILATSGQDLLTFGFLETYLEKLIKPWPAAFLTILVFFLGHFYFQWSFLILIFIAGFAGFAVLRKKMGSVYPINIIHLIFSLLPWQF